MSLFTKVFTALKSTSAAFTVIQKLSRIKDTEEFYMIIGGKEDENSKQPLRPSGNLII